ncbi:MAG: FtsH protease activity modulator HflK [Steroidobacteraceae bacterium]|nr:FtsH protease activity modulator HflK [Steroidobacteraceae bacterium]
MAWNQPGSQQNPWGRRPGPEGLDQALKEWQRRFESLFGGGGKRGGGLSPLLLLGALVAVWLLSGFYQVQPAERGVLQRFGKFVGVRDPGLGWRLRGVETITKVNVSQVNTVKYESRVLTADVNLVNLTLAVQYQFSDPVKMLFGVRDPESSLREVSESAIREVVGRGELEAILVSARQQVTERTKELIQRTLDFYGTGIRVTSVNLTEVQVPEAVVPSQRDANKAIADRDRLQKEAEAYQSGIIPVAEGAAARQIQDAEGYKAQVTALAEGEAARFTQLRAAYEAAPAVTRRRLYIDTIESVLKGSKKVVIDSKGVGNSLIYLPLDKLTEGRAREVDTSAGSRPASGAASEPETVTVDGRQRGER